MILVRAEFAHLKPDEREIMRRFVDKKLLEGKYEYDVHLTVPDPVWPEKTTEEEKQIWRSRIAKRIDAVCTTPSGVWIIEVTPKVSKAAVGGLFLYRQMYRAQYHPVLPVHLVCVVAIDDTAYHNLLTENKITLFVV